MPHTEPKITSYIAKGDERSRHKELQKHLPALFDRLARDLKAPRTVVIIPSLTFDEEMLSRVPGAFYFEERMLCMLMLLRRPLTKIVFVTSMPIEECIIDYYLQMLPGIPHRHSLRRLTFLSCGDPSPKPLTKKILERPELIEKIKQAVDDPLSAKITCYNSTPYERTLALRLGLPIYSCDPELLELGSKSGSRQIFREVGLNIPYGHENLRDQEDIAEAISEMKTRTPELRRAVIKHNYGGDGLGNAVFDFTGDYGTLSGSEIKGRLMQLLPTESKLAAEGETWESYIEKFTEMRGIVESWIEGEIKRSPSAQFKIDPLGEVRIESTHDQVLGGKLGQMFTGCVFPASEDYRLDIQNAGRLVAERLKEKGVINVLGVDFITVKEGQSWKSYAIEINLRKGGTTFPYTWLRFLTDGYYDPDSGLYLLKSGEPRYYYSSDSLRDERYKGLRPHDLLDIMVYNGLHFDSTSQTGVVFHLLGTIHDYGKFGVTCIGADREQAFGLYEETISVMNSALNL